MLNVIRSRVNNLPHGVRLAIMVAFDFVALSGALWSAYSVRYASWQPLYTLDHVLIMLSAPIIAVPVFYRMGLYRVVIRYLPERALWTIVRAMTIAAICWVVLAFLSQLAGRGAVPRSVPLIYWAFGTIAISAGRFAAKALLASSPGPRAHQKPIAIYGAGDEGAQLANLLRAERDLFIIGIVDDDPHFRDRDVAGLRVFELSDIPGLVEQFNLREVILASSQLPPAKRREIVAEVSRHGVQVRTIPPIADLMSGKYAASQMHAIDIDDLLGRSTVPAETALVRQMIEGRAIMVTGAGGSIGSELCRLIAKWSPKHLVLLEASEFALYQIERELGKIAGLSLSPVLGSITDTLLIERTIRDNGIEVIFHAAAHKHVPLVEANALEGIRNNVFGTLNVATLAADLGVTNFVLISSDKAVRPTNVMGATKRWAELIVEQKMNEATQRASGQVFTAVRFGNVLGSNGSVVPLFKEQIANGGPLTVTDPAMTRYFMSIHEAAELIVQAGALSRGGDVFLLEMGEPVLILDLAENMIRLAGHTVRDEKTPDGDIEIVVTGKRPGEKMFEELFYDDANAEKTQHPKILRAHAESREQNLTQALTDLSEALARQDEAAARDILFRVIQ